MADSSIFSVVKSFPQVIKYNLSVYQFILMKFCFDENLGNIHEWIVFGSKEKWSWKFSGRCIDSMYNTKWGLNAEKRHDIKLIIFLVPIMSWVCFS